MKKNRKLIEALDTPFEIEELQDPHLESIAGGCGPMGGGTNFSCGPITNSRVEGTAIAEATCPAKPIFTGISREF